MPETINERSLYRFLEANARMSPSAPAYRAKLRGVWKTWSWVEVLDEVVSLHQLLDAAGVRGGDLVGISGECNPRLYWYVLALQRAAAVPVLLNSRASQREFHRAYEKAEFSVFIAGTESEVDVAVQTRPKCPKLRLVLVLDRGLETDTHDGFVSREDDLAVGNSIHTGLDLVERPDPRAVVLCGYDEAGESLLVVWSHAAALKAAMQFASLAGLRPTDQLVTFLPVAWFGDYLQFSAALIKGALVSSAENAATVSQDMQRLAPDVLFAPVATYRKMLGSDRGRYQTLWTPGWLASRDVEILGCAWASQKPHSPMACWGGVPITAQEYRWPFKDQARFLCGRCVASRARELLCSA
ncbi:hypothetical protein MESS2_310001 [Mesorhizobium metallidurans STM 2683]|uniref:AMP-dependent synthetase/ligase domain-containing protein n=1 Tax=Mesorhizobium metallidurans STM 2683 TaxID=1297569 RepID=M5F3G4_9HYPH|nr:AMP-binding protein [Mesorhizobium metallidurans]CCV06376.1 hypothetical protein MESS2_310001 [Mesorhizobium metallidurans STM 2683]